MPDATAATRQLTASNDFNAGWLSCILGDDAPKNGECSDSWLEGWDTAYETHLCRTFGEVMRQMRAQGQVTVRDA